MDKIDENDSEFEDGFGHAQKHYRQLMLEQFRQGTKNARKAQKRICEEYGGSILSERTVQKWFKKFRKGDFNLIDEERSGRPIMIDDNKLTTVIEQNPEYTLRKLADIFNSSRSSIATHLAKLNYVKNRENGWIRRPPSSETVSPTSTTTSPSSTPTTIIIMNETNEKEHAIVTVEVQNELDINNK